MLATIPKKDNDVLQLRAHMNLKEEPLILGTQLEKGVEFMYRCLVATIFCSMWRYMSTRQCTIYRIYYVQVHVLASPRANIGGQHGYSNFHVEFIRTSDPRLQYLGPLPGMETSHVASRREPIAAAYTRILLHSLRQISTISNQVHMSIVSQCRSCMMC